MTEQKMREKAIKGLKYLHDVQYWSLTEREQDAMIRRNITKYVLDLLKSQEPIKPHVEYNPAGQPMWCCGNCGTTLFFKFPKQTDDEDEKTFYKFCHYCGQAVKWND